MKPEITITVINQHTLNYGDDAAGVALVLQVRHWFPNACINITYNRRHTDLEVIPYNDKNIHHFPSLIISEWNFFQAIFYLGSKLLPIKRKCKDTNIGRFRKQIIESDIVIVSPCGANIGIYTSWLFLFRVLMAVLENKPVYFHLNTLGKSGNLIFDMFARFALKRSHLFVREYRSHRELSSWGIHSSIGVDTAFSLPDLEQSESDCDGKKIVFIPTQLGNWHPHFSNKFDDITFDKIIAETAFFCKEIDAKIYILPHLYGRLDEKEFLDRVLAAFLQHDASAQMHGGIRDFWDYEKAIAQSYLVISMRYHGLVLAAKNSIPFLSLSYENKMDEVCKYTDMDSFNILLRSVEKVSIAEKLEELTLEHSSIVYSLSEKKYFLRQLSSSVVPEIYLRSLYLD
ncbi:MAG: polysaccharide pyruvyl transferase family protein [Cyanobacteria bacterium P01_F01_bin.33]